MTIDSVVEIATEMLRRPPAPWRQALAWLCVIGAVLAFAVSIRAYADGDWRLGAVKSCAAGFDLFLAELVRGRRCMRCAR